MGTHTRSALLLGWLSLMAIALPLRLAGQDPCPAEAPPLQMSTLLEKTIFRVDVLELRVSLSGEPATRLRLIAADGKVSNQERDSVALIASDATCATATIDFVRNISLGRLLNAIRSSSHAARDAGLIAAQTDELISTSLPDWYRFLQGRGVKDGDRMEYRMRGDTLHIRYLTGAGDLLLDRTDVGADQRRSVLAGYFAPGSDFRDGLIRSLVSPAED